jgi:hypothetical protein
MERPELERIGEIRRTESFPLIAAYCRNVLAGLAASTAMLLVGVLLWRVLVAAGDHAGASTFFAMTVVVAGVWFAHWLGLILLNSISVAGTKTEQR